jgi:hypothetical protein
MKITIDVHALYTEEEKQVHVHISALFGIIRFHIDVLDRIASTKNIDETEKEQKQEETTKEVDKKSIFHSIIKSIGEIHTIVKKFLKRVTIRELTWESSIGTGDAASTGMIAGVCWTGKGWLLGLMASYFQMKDRVDINIVPNFQGTTIRTAVNLRLSFRVWSVLFFALSFLRFWRKQQRVHYHASHENSVEQGGVS